MERDQEYMFERWPGYNQQNWHERFLELDRRHKLVNDRLVALTVSKSVGRTSAPVVEIGQEIPDLTDEQFAAIESLAQRQAREVMNPKSGQATASTSGRAFNEMVEGIMDRYPKTMAYLASKEGLGG